MVVVRGRVADGRREPGVGGGGGEGRAKGGSPGVRASPRAAARQPLAPQPRAESAEGWFLKARPRPTPSRAPLRLGAPGLPGPRRASPPLAASRPPASPVSTSTPCRDSAGEKWMEILISQFHPAGTPTAHSGHCSGRRYMHTRLIRRSDRYLPAIGAKWLVSDERRKYFRKFSISPRKLQHHSHQRSRGAAGRSSWLGLRGLRGLRGKGGRATAAPTTPPPAPPLPLEQPL